MIFDLNQGFMGFMYTSSQAIDSTRMWQDICAKDSAMIAQIHGFV